MSDALRPTHTKQSDLVFARQVEAFETKIRRSNAWYNVIRKSFISLGVTIAVALPLSMLPAPADPTENSDGPTETNSTLQFNNYYQPEIGSSQTPIHTHPPDHSHDPGSTALREIVTVPTNVTINSVPPLNREWHRSVFENIGDRLWALPNVNFVIALESLEQGCSKSSCQAAFSLRSDSYLPVGDGSLSTAFSIGSGSAGCRQNASAPFDENRCVDVHPSLKNQPVQMTRCQLNTNPLVPVTACHFRAQLSGTRDLCLWLRRSVVPEREDGGEVALDVKWRLMDDTQTECLDWSSRVPFRE